MTVAKKAIKQLQIDPYKDKPVFNLIATIPTSTVNDEDEQKDDDASNPIDQLFLYEVKPYLQILVKESPVAYQISKKAAQLQLTQMALDIYSVVKMKLQTGRTPLA